MINNILASEQVSVYKKDVSIRNIPMTQVVKFGEDRYEALQKKARLAAIDQFLTDHTHKITSHSLEAAGYREFAAMRPDAVVKLTELTKRSWLKHAFVTSDNEQLVQGAILGLRDQLPDNIPIIQINAKGSSLAEVKEEFDKERSSFNLFELLKLYTESNDASMRSTIETTLEEFYAKFKERHHIVEGQPAFIIVNDVDIKQADKLKNGLGLLEKLDPNIHIIATGKKVNPADAMGPQMAMMPASVKQMLGAVISAIGSRFGNIEVLDIPRIRNSEWATLLQNPDNVAGKAARQIFNSQGFELQEDVLSQFIEAVSLHYDERPDLLDILAELDLFGAFFNRIKEPGQREATSTNVRRYIQEEFAERLGGAEDLNIFEEIGSSMQVPNPFKVVKHESAVFADVIGHDQAKEAIRDVLDPVNRILFESTGSSSHSNVTTVLMVGPPGTGKTELAKAAAGEHNGTFITANASEFINSFQASGTTNVKRLNKLIQTANSEVVVVFIDEIDAIGSRDGNLSGEEYRTLNSLLTQIQGAGKGFNKTVLFMFATNKPERLDEAFMKRVERQIQIDPPNEADRQAIWELQLRKAGIVPDQDTDLRRIARLTDGKVGRDIFFIVKSLKKQLIREMPYADKLAITQSPERLKTFKLKASQQQIEANIQLYNSEHAVNKQSSGDDFGFAGMAKRMKSS